MLRNFSATESSSRSNFSRTLMSLKNVILVIALLVLNNTQECQARGYYTHGDLHGSLVAIFGKVYNMTEYNNEREPILFLAKDSSRIFPRTPISRLPTLCLDVTKGDYLSVHQYPRCLELTALDKINGATCHNRPIGTRKAHAYFKPYEIGELVIPETELEANGRQWIAIDATVYDVTQYLGGLRDETGQINKDPYHPNAYLHASLHSLIVDNVNTDASKVYEERFDGMSHMLCLDELFYSGYYGYDPERLKEVDSRIVDDSDVAQESSSISSAVAFSKLASFLVALLAVTAMT